MILRSMMATRGMYCRSLLMPSRRSDRKTRHQVNDGIRVLVADLDEQQCRRAPGSAVDEIDDLPDVAEAVFAGDQRQRRLVLAHFRREILVLALGHVRRIRQDEIERLRSSP